MLYIRWQNVTFGCADADTIVRTAMTIEGPMLPPRAELKPGDRVFWKDDVRNKDRHVAFRHPLQCYRSDCFWDSTRVEELFNWPAITNRQLGSPPGLTHVLPESSLFSTVTWASSSRVLHSPASDFSP
jgi:hypothetical protein